MLAAMQISRIAKSMKGNGHMQQGPYPPSGEQPSYPSYPTPQQPQQRYYGAPPQQPQPYGYGAPIAQATYTRDSSFTNKAVIAFLLYFLG